MNLFRTPPPPDTAATWPARTRSIAYVQVGDLVEMWVRRKQAGFAACEFCQTVIHLSDGRCHICGGAVPARDEPEPGATALAAQARAARPSSTTSLGNVMRLAILPPLLLFAVFAAWYQLRAPAAVPRAIPSLAPAASQAKLARPDPMRGHGPLVDLGLGEGETALSSSQSAAVSATDADADLAPASPAERSTPPSKTRKAAVQASVRPEQDPLAACSNSNFFSRAICVNTVCADPKTAHLGQCRDAIRQRQIDEARRNPNLMG